MIVAPAGVALLVALWRLDGPSLWRDEAVTAGVSRLPVGDMLAVLSRTDAVHGVYYLLMHVVQRAFGGGEAALRLPSVLATVAAAAGTAAVGRRLGGRWPGLAAGLLFAGAPLISRYAQEARSYAIVTALAVTATYLLVRAVDGGGRCASVSPPCAHLAVAGGAS